VQQVCVACLDLLLRWAVVRLAEGNAKTLVGVTGMLKALFDLLGDQGYRWGVHPSILSVWLVSMSAVIRDMHMYTCAVCST
jgi:hypothetical protein